MPQTSNEELLELLMHQEEIIKKQNNRIEELREQVIPDKIEESRRNRIARAGNSLIFNLEALNNDALMFFAELEDFNPATQRTVLRQMKQFRDLLHSQLDLHNLAK